METLGTSTAPAEDEGPARVLGLILAGGRARRLGGGDKALVEVGGRAMLDHVIAALAPQVASLVLNANDDPARFARWGLQVVADEVPDLGPLGGLLAGMRHAKAHLPAVRYILTVPVDAPFLPPDLGRRLGEAMPGEGVTIAVAQSGGRLHHVIALWPVGLEAALTDALGIGVRRVEAFAAAQGVHVVDWPLAGYDPFMNVNTPADLAHAHKILKLMLAT